MKRKSFYLGIDTETTNSLTTEDGKLDLSNSLVYDVGWQIIDRKGRPYVTRSYVVAEIFLDKPLMKEAFFSDKIPQYWEDIKNGKRILTSFLKIRKQFLIDRKKYNCKAVFAHNAYFDYNALNITLRLLTGSKMRYFFPYKCELWDTLKMSRDVIGKTASYTRFCVDNNYRTKHKVPQNRLTAEILWRYISGNNNFMESHTGLEDVQIESEIMLYCLNTHKKMRRRLFNKQGAPLFFYQCGPGQN